MEENIKSFILKGIQKKSKLPKDVSLDDYDYISSGFVDSIGIIKFVLEIEAEFDIAFSEADLETPEFRTVGGLLAMVRGKVAAGASPSDA